MIKRITCLNELKKKKICTVQFLWVYLLAVLFSNTYSWTLLSKVNIIIKNMTKQNHYPPYPQTAPLLVMGIRETRLSNYLFSLTLWLNEASFRFSQLWQNSSDDTVQQLWRQQVQQKHSFWAYTHLSCVFWETPPVRHHCWVSATVVYNEGAVQFVLGFFVFVSDEQECFRCKQHKILTRMGSVENLIFLFKGGSSSSDKPRTS